MISPVHPLRQLAGDRQPEPRAAGRVGGVEALEDPALDALRDARPLVGDGQLGAAVGGVGGHGHLGALGRVGEGVVEQDTDDLSHPVGVGAGRSPAARACAAPGASRAVRRGRRTRASPRGPARRGRRCAACITIAPASSWERSSRSAVSFVRRSICWRIVRTNSARSSGLGSSSSSSSTKPPRLKIGVRSSCEALAMNCLRALSSSARRRCISLKVRASWPELAGGGDRDRRLEVAVGDFARGVLEAADVAGGHAARSRGRRRWRSADRDQAADRGSGP